MPIELNDTPAIREFTKKDSRGAEARIVKAKVTFVRRLRKGGSVHLLPTQHSYPVPAALTLAMDMEHVLARKRTRTAPSPSGTAGTSHRHVQLQDLPQSFCLGRLPYLLLLLFLLVASPVVQCERSISERWGRSKALPNLYQILCSAGIREQCCRIDPSIMDKVNAAYAPAVAYPPPKDAPPLMTQPKESLESRLDCSAKRFAQVLTGKRRPKPRMVLDAFLFSHELEILQVRMLEHGDAVDYFVIGESNYTLRGTYKPIFTRMAPERFDSLEKKMIRFNLADCDGMQDALEFRRANPEVSQNAETGSPRLGKPFMSMI